MIKGMATGCEGRFTLDLDRNDKELKEEEESSGMRVLDVGNFYLSSYLVFSQIALLLLILI